MCWSGKGHNPILIQTKKPNGYIVICKNVLTVQSEIQILMPTANYRNVHKPFVVWCNGKIQMQCTQNLWDNVIE